MIGRLRRKLAGWILGEQTAMFVSDADKKAFLSDDYLDLSNEVLGELTRRWFVAIGRAHHMDADQKKKPVSIMTGQHAVLAIAKMAREANADTMQITIDGTIDGGRSNEIYQIDFKKLAEHEFVPGVEKDFSADGEKLVRLQITY